MKTPAIAAASLFLSMSLSLVLAAPPLARVAFAADADEAEKHYRNGLTLRAQRQDDEALHAFRHAYSLFKAPRTLAQIAFAEQALGLWVDAEAHLLEAMTAATDPWIVKNKLPLDQSLAHVQDRLATIELAGGLPQAEVRINGKLIGTLPLAKPIRAVAGTIALEVRASGHLPLQRSLIVSPRGLARETIDLVPAAGSTPGPVPAPGVEPAGVQGAATTGVSTNPMAPGDGRAPMEKHVLAGWVTLGVAGAALGTGLVFQLIRESRISTFNTDAQCMIVAGKVQGGAACQASYDSAGSAQTKAIVGYVAAGVLGATSAVLLLVLPRGGEKRANGMALACGAGPGDFGLACGATF